MLLPQATVAALNAELQNLRRQLEEVVAAHEQEAKALCDQSRDLEKQKESAFREVSGLLTHDKKGPYTSPQS